MYINIIYKLLHDEANDELSDPLESNQKRRDGRNIVKQLSITT